MGRGKIVLDNYKMVPATMEITLSVGDWEKVAEELSNNYPSFKIKGAIIDLVYNMKVKLSEEVEIE